MVKRKLNPMHLFHLDPGAFSLDITHRGWLFRLFGIWVSAGLSRRGINPHLDL